MSISLNVVFGLIQLCGKVLFFSGRESATDLRRHAMRCPGCYGCYDMIPFMIVNDIEMN